MREERLSHAPYMFFQRRAHACARRLIPVLLFCALALDACLIAPPPSPATVTSTATTTVTGAAMQPGAQRSVKFGTAVGYFQLMNDARYRETLRSSFTMVVPENEMKFDAIEPREGVFDFSQADTIVKFARINGIAVRGHALVTGGQLPAWLTTGHLTRNQLIAILKTHIMTEVGHYRGEIAAWDVVNEAVNSNTLQLNANIWERVIGPDYISLAFTWAHEADPNAELFYNDFGGEDMGGKSDAIYKLVTGLRHQGIPVNGVGLELHVSLWAHPNERQVAENMRRLAAAGLKVAITEMDVQVRWAGGTAQSKAQAQAKLFGAFAAICRSVSACDAFDTWGFTDRYTWLIAVVHAVDTPLEFDVNYQPKPAYYAIKNALFGPLPSATATPR